MAEVMETHVPMGKINGGLTTGIIGTSLAGLLALKSGLFNGILGGIAPQPAAAPEACNLPFGSLYNERKENQDYIELTKQYYEGQIVNREDLNNKFFSLYKQHVDDSFALYKGQRDTKDDLIAKINEVEKKVDVMAAIRPYQDALINTKIDNVALVGDFNLARRTCRMIQGELVLPSTPTVTGYASYSPCTPIAPSSGA
jgi:hypothetical protein